MNVMLSPKCVERLTAATLECMQPDANSVAGRKAGTYPSSFISDGRTERSVTGML